jgi:hypothetical protein
MSLEMAHKVIVPQKKIMSRSFLNSGTLIVILAFPNYDSSELHQIGSIRNDSFHQEMSVNTLTSQTFQQTHNRI